VVATLLFLALALAAELAVWSAWRRDVTSAVSAASAACFMAALLLHGRATAVLVALGLGCFAWWVILRRNRTTRGKPRGQAEWGMTPAPR
jgi:hypothetical protein